MTSIKPHGGTLINRLAEGQEREALLTEAKGLRHIPINAWVLSDLDLIAVGAFSPLTGFLNEEDYHSVVSNMRLADGTVWSIPITLPLEGADASLTGERVALVGENDGVVYAILHVPSIPA